MSEERRTTSTNVIETVAESVNKDPLDLPPLYEEIDPDALDTILENTTDGSVSFQYAGVEVTAYSDGKATVAENPGPDFRQPTD